VDTPSHGLIIIRGPGAWELCENFCAGKATMIRSDGQKVLSVERLTKKQAKLFAEAREDFDSEPEETD